MSPNSCAHDDRPPPTCENNPPIPKFDGNNTSCCSDKGRGALIKGKVGHGSKRCRNNTDCYSRKRGVGTCTTEEERALEIKRRGDNGEDKMAVWNRFTDWQPARQSLVCGGPSTLRGQKGSGSVPGVHELSRPCLSTDKGGGGFGRREWDSRPSAHQGCFCPLASLSHAEAGDASHSATIAAVPTGTSSSVNDNIGHDAVQKKKDTQKVMMMCTKRCTPSVGRRISRHFAFGET